MQFFFVKGKQKHSRQAFQSRPPCSTHRTLLRSGCAAGNCWTGTDAAKGLDTWSVRPAPGLAGPGLQARPAPGSPAVRAATKSGKSRRPTRISTVWHSRLGPHSASLCQHLINIYQNNPAEPTADPGRVARGTAEVPGGCVPNSIPSSVDKRPGKSRFTFWCRSQ